MRDLMSLFWQQRGSGRSMFERRCFSRPRLSTALPVLALPTLLIAAFLVEGCARGPSEAVVESRDITATALLKGEVVAPAAARADVHTPYTVAVADVFVTVGKNVRKGDALLLFSAPTNEAYYDQARSAVAAAERALASARSTYAGDLRAAQKALADARAAERRARNAPADQAELPSVEPTNMRMAQEQAVIDAQARMNEGLAPYQQALVAAQEEFRAAQQGAKAAQLKAPIDGTVLAVNIGVGETPDPDNKKPLVTIVNLAALKVAGEADEKQIALLKPDSHAMVTIKEVPGTQFHGSLDEIYSEKAGFLVGRKDVALIDFENTGGKAKPGNEAEAAVTIGEVRDVLAVPTDAVKEDGSHYVVKVKSGTDWVNRRVEIGLSDGRFTEVRSGLKRGEVVIVAP